MLAMPPSIAPANRSRSSDVGLQVQIQTACSCRRVSSHACWSAATAACIGLPDGSDALIHYSSSKTDDAPEQANLWRRDLRYMVNFPTTLLQMQPAVLFAGVNLTTTAQNGTTTSSPGWLQP